MAPKHKKMFFMQEDKHEMMEKFWNLQKQKEDLKKKLNSLESECEKYENILLTSTADEIEEFCEDNFSPKKISRSFKEKSNSLKTFSSFLTTNINGIRILFSNKDTIFHFLPPVPITYDRIPPSEAIVVFEQYNLKKVILPGGLSVEDLKEKYLQKDDLNLDKFLYYVHHLLLMYWERYQQVQNVKIGGYMENSLIYHNSNCTVVSFNFRLMKTYTMEMKLRYETLSILPYEITYTDSEHQDLPREVIDALEEVKISLFKHSLSNVLKINFDSTVDSTTQSDSGDTVLFNLYE